MAVRKINLALPDSRKDVALRNDPTQVDPKKLKLGKQLARHDPRTLLLASYVTPALPTPPAQADLTTKVNSWGMMENDQLGDCTCAAAGHLIMEWTANAGKKIVTPTDKQIVAPTRRSLDTIRRRAPTITARSKSTCSTTGGRVASPNTRSAPTSRSNPPITFRSWIRSTSSKAAISACNCP